MCLRLTTSHMKNSAGRWSWNNFSSPFQATLSCNRPEDSMPCDQVQIFFFSQYVGKNTGKQPVQWDWVWESWGGFRRQKTQKLPGIFLANLNLWKTNSGMKRSRSGAIRRSKIRPTTSARTNKSCRFSKTSVELQIANNFRTFLASSSWP